MVRERSNLDEVPRREEIPPEHIRASWALVPLLILGARSVISLPMLANLIALKTGEPPVGPDLQMSGRALARVLLEVLTGRRLFDLPPQVPGQETGEKR